MKERGINNSILAELESNVPGVSKYAVFNAIQGVEVDKDIENTETMAIAGHHFSGLVAALIDSLKPMIQVVDQMDRPPTLDEVLARMKGMYFQYWEVVNPK